MPTDQERIEALRMLQGASLIAQKYGMLIRDESDSPRQAITAMAIMISSMGVAAGVTMHELMGVVMEVYKKTLEFSESEGQE